MSVEFLPPQRTRVRGVSTQPIGLRAQNKANRSDILVSAVFSPIGWSHAAQSNASNRAIAHKSGRRSSRASCRASWQRTPIKRPRPFQAQKFLQKNTGNLQ
ncbi:MAG TPA: hypothetical protein VKX28_32170 [Xanthobacteraceae bacterium]|nr:hypothetical protein [Xanthobacteraceae bacterium]